MDENIKIIIKEGDGTPTSIDGWSDNEMADVLRQASLLIGTTVDGSCRLQSAAVTYGAIKSILGRYIQLDSQLSFRCIR